MNDNNSLAIIDTHVLIWDLLNIKKITEKALKVMSFHEAKGTLCFCSISYWEIGLLVNKSKLNLDRSIEEFLKITRMKRAYNILEIDAKVAAIISNFDSEINNDPADRLIVATAIRHNAVLLTADKNILNYTKVKTIW